MYAPEGSKYHICLGVVFKRRPIIEGDNAVSHIDHVTVGGKWRAVEHVSDQYPLIWWRVKTEIQVAVHISAVEKEICRCVTTDRVLEWASR